MALLDGETEVLDLNQRYCAAEFADFTHEGNCVQSRMNNQVAGRRSPAPPACYADRHAIPWRTRPQRAIKLDCSTQVKVRIVEIRE